jgi:hypothetical protein
LAAWVLDLYRLCRACAACAACAATVVQQWCNSGAAVVEEMKPISVLLVDDNPAFLRIATRFLQQHDDIVVVGGPVGAKRPWPWPKTCSRNLL